jgi:hypothetical protein
VNVETTKLVDINLDRDQVLLISLCGRWASAIEAVGWTIDVRGARDDCEVNWKGSVRHHDAQN